MQQRELIIPPLCIPFFSIVDNSIHYIIQTTAYYATNSSPPRPIIPHLQLSSRFSVISAINLLNSPLYQKLWSVPSSTVSPRLQESNYFYNVSNSLFIFKYNH